MKCDELQYERLGDANKTYPESTLVIRKQFVDGAIDELKREHHRERHEYIDMVAQLKAENQRLKKKMDDYHLMSDIRRAKIKGLKRALWLARAERAVSKQAYYDILSRGISSERDEMYDMWNNVERKCLKKSKEYL